MHLTHAIQIDWYHLWLGLFAFGLFEGGIPGFGNPITATISVIGTIVKFLFGLGDNMKSFAHDVTLSLKLAWGAIAQPILSTLDLIKGWLVGLIGRLKKIIEAVKAKLGAILTPIIKYAKQVRQFWDDLFNHYIKPILNTIQHIRQTLTIFKVFHLKFATALDARLAKLEGDIAGRFLIVKQNLNKYLSILEQWADPFGYVSGNAIWRALVTSANGIMQMYTGKDIRKIIQSPGATAPTAVELVRGGEAGLSADQALRQQSGSFADAGRAGVVFYQRLISASKGQ